MIEVRIDIDWMQGQQHNILHSILMMEALRTAGMPVIGKIVFNGPERGKLITWREQDLDADVWVVRWFDGGEDATPGAASWKRTSSGKGKGFTWLRYETGSNSADKVIANETPHEQSTPTTTSEWDELGEDDL